MSVRRNLCVVAGLLGMSLLQSGCSVEKPVAQDDSATKVSADDHSGWWCTEHGIPEEECSMCSASAAKSFQEKGDWCEEHNRAESQCFKCDATRADKYAKLYEAKYGTKPPAVTE